MDNPYIIRLMKNGKWEVYRRKFPDISFPDSIGTKNHALSYMASLLHVTLAELRKAAREGSLRPTVS